ncbi:hypothetical protein F4859DRAFT_521186 [Xylaria cf. heliscus]|nr:hypothetical protein F4859DRAFT_521186 [Xylaria cf. heliscus]
MEPIILIFIIAWVLAEAVVASPPSLDEPEIEPLMHRCGKFQAAPDIAQGPVQYHAVATTYDDLYVIGGIPANHTLPGFITRNEVLAYKYASQSWRQVADFPIRIVHANAAGVDGGIYVLGGLTDNGKDPFWNYTTACFVYRPETGKWDPLPPMPDNEARGAAMVGVHGSTIYLAGGLRSLNLSVGGLHESVAKVTAYDTRTNMWRTMRSLPEPRDYGGGAVMKSKFWVVGGRDHARENIKNNTWVLNLKKWGSDWVRMKDMPTARAGFALGTHGHKLLIFGGEGNLKNPTGVFSATEVYNVRRDQWKRAVPMPIPRHGFGAISFRQNTWMAGGGLVSGSAQPNAHAERFTLITMPPNDELPHFDNSSYDPVDADHKPAGCLT